MLCIFDIDQKKQKIFPLEILAAKLDVEVYPGLWRYRGLNISLVSGCRLDGLTIWLGADVYYRASIRAGIIQTIFGTLEQAPHGRKRALRDDEVQ